MTEFFKLDPYKLVDEWVSQVALYHDHATQLADAREQCERCKAREEVQDDDRKRVAAEIDLEVRKSPERYGLQKATEGAINNVVLTHQKYREAQAWCYKARKATIKAQHAKDVLEAAVKTLDNRKSALQDLVQLQGRDYYSEPRIPKGYGERVRNAEVEQAFPQKRNKE